MSRRRKEEGGRKVRGDYSTKGKCKWRKESRRVKSIGRVRTREWDKYKRGRRRVN